MSWQRSTMRPARVAHPGVWRVLALAGALLLPGLPAVAQDAQQGYGASMKAGRAAYQANDWPTAERHFDAAAKAAENDRQKGSAIYALGVVAQKQNKIPEAKQHAEQALALNPADKQAKGLLDEVNAAPQPTAKGKAKASPKGLAKTPLPPGNKQTASGAAKAAAPKQAGDAGKTAPATAGAATPKGAKPAAKPPAKAVAPGDTPPPLPPTAPPAPKSGALEPGSEGAAVAVAAAVETSAREKAEPANPIVTASLTEPAAAPRPAPDQAPAVASAPTPPAVSPPRAFLPTHARYVEIGCGPDYRADGKSFARAVEITATADAGVGEILSFELACAQPARHSGVNSLAPASVIVEDDGGQIRLASLERSPEGGWTPVSATDERATRLRPEGDFLAVLPTRGEVALLRRRLAENPSRIEAMAPELRRDLERAVAGEGFQEYRLVRAEDHLDAAFDRARKLAKRIGTRTAQTN